MSKDQITFVRNKYFKLIGDVKFLEIHENVKKPESATE
jgi:hypothetical protein